MKNRLNLIVLLFFFIIFSCKKESNLIVAQSKNIARDSIKTLVLPTDSKSFVYNKDKNGYYIYDNTFKKNEYSNSLSRVYGKIPFDNNIDLILIERKPNDDEYTEPIITLYSFKKNTKKKIDSLNIYETINGEGSSTKRFFIDKQKNVNVYENSSGYDFDDNGKELLIKENHHLLYNVKSDGKFVLIKEVEGKNNIETINSIKSSNWNGSYYFEASNRDNVKTIFDIIINSLDDISVNITEEDMKNKYTHLKAEEMGNEKIKITYDNSSDDMGTIYIEKSDGNYFISGNPIY